MGVVHSTPLATPTVYKANGDGTSTAVLTYPIYDAEGEWVQPDGGDWSRYPLNPLVNWHHQTPIGRGEVCLKAIGINGKNWVVPVGTVRFFESAADLAGLDLRIRNAQGQPTAKSWDAEQCLSMAAQAKYLVTNDHATGVSIELDPLERRAIGPSRLKKGFAFAYPKWVGLGWAHTYAGDQINAGAQTVAKAKRAETLDLVRGGKLPDGTKLDGVILKAFAPLLSTTPTTVRVTGTPPTRKAMNDDPYAPTDPVADAPMGTDDLAPAPEMEPKEDIAHEIQTAEDMAQLAADGASQLRESGQKTFDPATKKYYAKLAERWEADAEDLIAHAEELRAKQGDNQSEPDADDADADADTPPDGDADDETKKAHRLTYDDDGFPVGHAVKLERKPGGLIVTKSHYIPRLRLADLKPVAKSDLTTDQAAEFDRIMRETLALAPRPNRRGRVVRN